MMKTNDTTRQEGSVLLTTFLSITILSMICATSLYIASQNSTGGTQTASWQQSLTAAESGVDMAIRAMNTDDWSDWRSSSYSSGTTLPTSEPTPSSSATPSGKPDSSHYNFRPSSKCSMTMATGSEGALSTSAWVTIDQGGMSTAQDTNGKQWYRIRATGQASVAGPSRAGMNKLDNDLRNTIALKFNRKNSGGSLGPTRTIEVVMQPVVTSGWGRGISLRNSIQMSGGGIIDSYDSSSSFKSTGGVYDVTKRQSHGDIGTLNSASSDLRSTYVYGSLSYSGATAVKNTTNVQGAITTPFSPTLNDQSAPSWSSGSYTAYAGGSPPFTTLSAGSKSHPLLVKVTGDFTVSGGNSVTLVAANNGSDNNYVSIWITGKYTTSGSGIVTQQSGVKSTWYVGGDMTTSGSSFNNAGGLASAVTFIGYGGSGSKATISGSGAFVATLNAPYYDITISGSGSFNGALIGNSVNISGGASFHYDEALNTGAGSVSVGNYAFASWFEDNSDTVRSLTY